MQTQATIVSWKDELQKIVELFSSQALPDVTAKALINSKEKPCSKWSFGNQLLMMLAGTNDARGFRQWNEVGRHVSKGHHAFYILAPMVKNTTTTDPETGEESEERHLYGFKAVPVFRLEDTEGQELPVYKPVDPPPLLDVAERFGLKVQYEKANGVYGSADYKTKTITLGTEEWDVFFHELAHQVHRTFEAKSVHGEDPEAETIAQLCAATLARVYGRPADAWSWKYIAYYSESKTPEAVGRSCLRILQRAEKVLKLIIAASFGNEHRTVRKEIRDESLPSEESLPALVRGS